MKTILLVTTLSLSLPSFAQQPSASAKSSGDCSPNILANSGGVQFVCKTAIDAETSKKIVSLLNQILNKENQKTSTDEINRKLDDILEFLKKHEPRRLSEKEKTSFSDCLKATPGSFKVMALEGNMEAYQYASDFYEVFKAAGWKNEDTQPVGLVMIGGTMWTGFQVTFHGSWTDNMRVKAAYTTGSPEGTAVKCIQDMSLHGLLGNPRTDTPTGSIEIVVSEHP